MTSRLIECRRVQAFLRCDTGLSRIVADELERRHGSEHFADAAADVGRGEPRSDVAALASAAGEHREHGAKDSDAERRTDHACGIDRPDAVPDRAAGTLATATALTGPVLRPRPQPMMSRAGFDQSTGCR